MMSFFNLLSIILMKLIIMEFKNNMSQLDIDETKETLESNFITLS
jgi:hypothetical protein